jgi:hypothetical protein
MNILISINITSTKPTEYTKNIDKAENKALAYTKEIVQKTYITEKNIKKAKEIKHFNKRSVIFIINKAVN